MARRSERLLWKHDPQVARGKGAQPGRSVAEHGICRRTASGCGRRQSCTACVALCLQLGRTFKIDIEQLQGPQEKEASKKRTKSHKKRVASYAYAPLTQPGEEKHLRAYRVTIDPDTEHKGVEYHHEGEEFIYVLDGGLTIQVGQNTTTLKKGGSIHFNSSLHHKLSNPTSKRPSSWLSSTCPKEGDMPFHLSAEQEMVRLMARDFARRELEPLAAKRDKEEIIPLGCGEKDGAARPARV